MRFLPRALVAGGAGFAVSFIAACGGGSGLLSPDQAATISSDANALSSAVAARQCGAVSDASRRLGNDINNLPSDVNRTVQGNLNQAAATVAELADKACLQTTNTATTTPPTTATTTVPTTATTTPQTTATTTPPPTTSTTSTATTSTPTGTTSTQPTGGGGLGGVTTSGGGGAAGGGGNGQ